MADFGFTLGTSTINAAATGDLSNRLTSSLPALLHLDDALNKVRNEKLSAIPSGALTTSFKNDQEATWSVEGVDVTLSVLPTASGAITIFQTGELFSYHPGDDLNQTVSVSVPQGKVYVSITLNVGLSVTGGAAFSSGSFGVRGNASTNDTFALVNYKSFDEATTLETALKEAFGNFVLPFKAAGLDRLNDGDYLDFSFVGSLALGFGVTYGFSGLMLGGRSSGEIAASLDANPVGKLVFAARPIFRAKTEFSVKYKHDDAFRVVVGRKKSAQTNSASLYLFRVNKGDLKTQVTAEIAPLPGAKFDAASHLPDLIDKASGAVASKLPGELQAVAKKAISAGLTKAGSKVDSFVETINHKVNELLDEVNERKLKLQVIQEETDTKTALFQFDFDLDADPAMGGFDAAMKGDFVTAVTLPGVTLAPGSFVEHEFTSRTALGLEFFGLWKYVDATEYFRNTTVTYAGNGIFHVIGKTGVTEESGLVGRTGKCQVYFTASGNETAQTRTLADLDVRLTFVLTDTNNPDAARITQTTLGLLDAGSLADDVEAIRAVDLRTKVLQVTCSFPKGAYEALTFDAFTGGKPGPMPHTQDAQNYERFVRALSRLDPQGTPELVKAFRNWVVYNVVTNDQEGSTRPPDRRGFGTGWPNAFPSLNSLDRTRVKFYLESGQRFMNLCEDLTTLTALIDEAKTESAFKTLLDTLNGMVREDIPESFIKATLVGLLEATGTAPSNIQFSGTDADLIAVSFDAVRQMGAQGD